MDWWLGATPVLLLGSACLREISGPQAPEAAGVGQADDTVRVEVEGWLHGPCQAVPQLLPGRNVGRCPGLLLFAKEARKSRFLCDFAPLKNLGN